MTTEPKRTADDKIPGWTETVRRIRNYPALAASHKRLLDVVQLIDEIAGDTNELHHMLHALCPTFGSMCTTAIDQAEKVKP